MKKGFVTTALGLSAWFVLFGVAATSGEPSIDPGDQGDLHRVSGAIQGSAIADHVRVLASDEFEGRAPGTRGETLTLAYIRSQFERMGLTPWDSAGYDQKVPLVQASITGKPKIALRVGGKRITPVLREEIVPRLGRPTNHVAITGSRLVFAGHGVVAPEYGWDDFAGVDLSGATVILLYGDPGTSTGDSTLFAGKAGSRRGLSSSKFPNVASRGARAAIIVHTDESAGFPWKLLAGGGAGANQHFLAPETAQPELDAVIQMSAPEARVVFRAAGRDLDQEMRAANVRGFRAHEIGGTIDITLDAKVETIASHNLIGVVRGSDAPDEAVVMMAHWDHMGRDSTRKGDQIFNGAVDNATGVGALIEIARAFRAMPRAPRRTVVMVATTAEERGLLGSEYLARHPIYPLAKTAAAFAIDALFPYGAYDRTSVTGYGNSELEDVLAVVAARFGRKLQDDGAPQLGAFYRADNYPFSKRGVPGFLAVGNPDNSASPDSSEAMASILRYVQTKYHQPGDEYDPTTWNMAGIEEDARILFEFAWSVADDTRFPNWRWDSPYRALGDERRRREHSDYSSSPAVGSGSSSANGSIAPR